MSRSICFCQEQSLILLFQLSQNSVRFARVDVVFTVLYLLQVYAMHLQCFALQASQHMDVAFNE